MLKLCNWKLTVLFTDGHDLYGVNPTQKKFNEYTYKERLRRRPPTVQEQNTHKRAALKTHTYTAHEDAKKSIVSAVIWFVGHGAERILSLTVLLAFSHGRTTRAVTQPQYRSAGGRLAIAAGAKSDDTPDSGEERTVNCEENAPCGLLRLNHSFVDAAAW